MGRDRIIAAVVVWEEDISTHTPAWGATYRICADVQYRKYFNSHARVGRDTGSV